MAPLSLAHALDEAVRLHPDRPAVAMPREAGGATVTYAQLAAAAGRVALELRQAGVGRGDRVGLLCPKSIEAVAGLWGVLCAGAAYVPLDPLAPPSRAGLIAGDCQMKALLASSQRSAAVVAAREAVAGVEVIQIHGDGQLAESSYLDGLARPSALAPSFTPSVRPNSRDLAYILYTSGSTGAPKGVMVSHGACLSFAEWGRWRFALTPEDILSSHAPFHFDLSTFDLYASTLAGAKVVVLDEETVRFPMAASTAMAAEGITVWYSVPGALRAMLRRGRLARQDLSRLRTVLFAGEPYPVGELQQLREALPGVELFNLFGPTETNVCTYWEVPATGGWPWSSVPIGIDCENCQGVVVDGQLEPVADGVDGELLVRGGTLMEGYWGDPEKTAASFLPDFLHPHLADRLYRTGDLVRRETDGTYTFLGRADHRVKVRGHRVELGEVEAALDSLEEVRQAAVVAVPEGGEEGADNELIAFVVGETTDSEGGLQGVARALRRSLKGRLPGYMIPAQFRWLAKMPMTSTGKTDRQCLLAMAGRDESMNESGSKGSNPGERRS